MPEMRGMGAVCGLQEMQALRAMSGLRAFSLCMKSQQCKHY